MNGSLTVHKVETVLERCWSHVSAKSRGTNRGLGSSCFAKSQKPCEDSPLPSKPQSTDPPALLEFGLHVVRVVSYGRFLSLRPDGLMSDVAHSFGGVHLTLSCPAAGARVSRIKPNPRVHSGVSNHVPQCPPLDRQDHEPYETGSHTNGEKNRDRRHPR
jgi:hypothetical protein